MNIMPTPRKRGNTANVEQNTTNKGYFRGQRLG